MSKYQRKREGDEVGSRGPRPKKLHEKVITGLAIGRDRKIVPPDDVQRLAAIGCKNIEIAEWFGITEQSLRYNFSVELTKGRSDMKISLRRTMFNNAIHDNNTTMQIWLSKNLLGMSDSPLNSEANAPLPWSEGDDVSIEEYEETDDAEDNQEE